MDTGFITLHRKITDNPIWKNSQLSHLFLTLLLWANHEEKKTLFNGKLEVIGRGQLITGRFKLAEATGIPKGTIHSYIATLTAMGIISTKASNKFTLITILKYNDYQLQKTKASTKTSNQLAPKEQQDSTNNNVNNVTTSKEGETPVKELSDKRNPVIQELWDYGLTLGLSHTKQALNRYAIKRLLNKHPTDKLKKALEYSQKIRDEAYAPQVNNWMDLETKYLNLRNWVNKNANS